MALNTGERAEKRKMQKNQEQSTIEKVRWLCWTLSSNYRGAKRFRLYLPLPILRCLTWKKTMNMWMLCVYLLVNIQVCVDFSVAIHTWQRGLNYWMSVAVWTPHHLVAVVVCSTSMTFGIREDLSGQFMNIQNKKHQASDGWDLWRKWRRRPALGMTTVQVHQLMLMLQRGSCQSQTAVLFI